VSRALVSELFPDLRPQHVVTIEEGWDSLVLDVDGEWIVRVPRRDPVRECIEMELRLLPELAPALPVPVPRFEHLADGVRAVAYRKLDGAPVDVSRVAPAAALGRFLSALHEFPVERARELGAPSHDHGWRERYESFARGLLGRVGSMLGDDRDRADTMLSDFLDDPSNFEFTPRLIHADLGPAHILAREDELTGVIDWSDARIGDPALDLAWALHATPPAFARAVLAGYGSDDGSLAERALFFHRLGPWYELHYGVHFHQPAYVESGLAGVRSRLPAALR
jgi:aminoglycoside phosphotransferase (APT) family kinase protein